MAYCTLQDLIDRFGEGELVQLTDRSIPPVGVIDEAVVDRAIADAGAEIDASLQARYALPLALVPPLLNRLACDIARYVLQADAASDEVRRRYEDARATLRQLASGQASLGPDAGGSKPAESAGAQVASAGTQFGRDKAGGFI